MTKRSKNKPHRLLRPIQDQTRPDPNPKKEVRKKRKIQINPSKMIVSPEDNFSPEVKFPKKK
jgi:hypothetical protein